MARVYYPKKKSEAAAAPAAPAAPASKAKAKKTPIKKKAGRTSSSERLARAAAVGDAVADGIKSDYLTDLRFAPSAVKELEKASDEYILGLLEGGELPKRKQSRTAPKKPQLPRRFRGERA